jgi:hypothetical protein
MQADTIQLTEAFESMHRLLSNHLNGGHNLTYSGMNHHDFNIWMIKPYKTQNDRINT